MNFITKKDFERALEKHKQRGRQYAEIFSMDEYQHRDYIRQTLMYDSFEMLLDDIRLMADALRERDSKKTVEHVKALLAMILHFNKAQSIVDNMSSKELREERRKLYGNEVDDK